MRPLDLRLPITELPRPGFYEVLGLSGDANITFSIYVDGAPPPTAVLHAPSVASADCDFELDASDSADSTGAPIDMQWSCNHDEGQCAKAVASADSYAQQSTNERLRIRGGSLMTGNYTVCVNVSRSSVGIWIAAAWSTACATLRVGSSRVPVVALEQPPVQLSPQLEFGLSAAIIESESCTSPPWRSWWLMHDNNSSPVFLQEQQGGSPSLIVNPWPVPHGHYYRLRIVLSDTGVARWTATNQGEFAYETRRFWLDKPPLGGECIVAPPEGYVATTSFKLTSSAWEDDDLPLFHRFTILKQGAGTDHANAHSASGHWVVVRAWDIQNVVSPLLFDTNTTVRAQARDALGSVSSASAQVVVWQPAVAPDSQELLGALESVAASGDQLVALSAISSIASTIASSSTSVETENITAPATDEDRNALQEAKAKQIAAVADSLLNTLSNSFHQGEPTSDSVEASLAALGTVVSASAVDVMSTNTSTIGSEDKPVRKKQVDVDVAAKAAALTADVLYSSLSSGGVQQEAAVNVMGSISALFGSLDGSPEANEAEAQASTTSQGGPVITEVQKKQIELSEKLRGAIASLGDALLASKPVGQPVKLEKDGMKIEAMNVDPDVLLHSGSTVAGAEIPPLGVVVQDAAHAISGSNAAFAVQNIQWPTNPFAYAGKAGRLLEDVEGFDCCDIAVDHVSSLEIRARGAQVRVENLTTPILLKLVAPPRTNSSSGEKQRDVCQYFDEGIGAWTDHGCEALNRTDDGMIICACTHLSSFAPAVGKFTSTLTEAIARTVQCANIEVLSKESIEKIAHGVWWKRTASVFLFVSTGMFLVLIAVAFYNEHHHNKKWQWNPKLMVGDRRLSMDMMDEEEIANELDSEASGKPGFFEEMRKQWGLKVFGKLCRKRRDTQRGRQSTEADDNQSEQTTKKDSIVHKLAVSITHLIVSKYAQGKLGVTVASVKLFADHKKVVGAHEDSHHFKRQSAQEWTDDSGVFEAFSPRSIKPTEQWTSEVSGSGPLSPPLSPVGKRDKDEWISESGGLGILSPRARKGKEQWISESSGGALSPRAKKDNWDWRSEMSGRASEMPSEMAHRHFNAILMVTQQLEALMQDHHMDPSEVSYVHLVCIYFYVLHPLLLIGFFDASITADMRMLLFGVRFYGGLGALALFYQGHPTAGNECVPEEFLANLLQDILVAMISSLVSILPPLLLSLLCKRKFALIDDVPGTWHYRWVFLKLHIRPWVAYFFALGIIGFFLFYLATFIASMGPKATKHWFTSSMIILGKQQIVYPFATAVALASLAKLTSLGDEEHMAEAWTKVGLDNAWATTSRASIEDSAVLDCSPGQQMRSEATAWHEPPAVEASYASERSAYASERCELEAQTPLCQNCKALMAWTDYADGEYSVGWECWHLDKCGSTSEKRGAWRWWCRKCKNDICGKCQPCKTVAVKGDKFADECRVPVAGKENFRLSTATTTSGSTAMRFSQSTDASPRPTRLPRPASSEFDVFFSGAEEFEFFPEGSSPKSTYNSNIVGDCNKYTALCKFFPGMGDGADVVTCAGAVCPVTAAGFPAPAGIQKLEAGPESASAIEWPVIATRLPPPDELGWKLPDEDEEDDEEELAWREFEKKYPVWREAKCEEGADPRAACSSRSSRQPEIRMTMALPSAQLQSFTEVPGDALPFPPIVDRHAA